jgi:hypothetical protein
MLPIQQNLLLEILLHSSEGNFNYFVEIPSHFFQDWRCRSAVAVKINHIHDETNMLSRQC